MDHYQAPKSQLSDPLVEPTIWSTINKWILFIELAVIIFPMTVFLLLFSTIVIQNQKNNVELIFFAILATCSVIAMTSLSLLILNFVFRLQWQAQWWHKLPYIGLIPVIVGYFYDQLFPSNGTGTPKTTDIEAFIVGFVLFIPLAHFQLSQSEWFSRFRSNTE